MKITLHSGLLAAAIAAVTAFTPTIANAAGTLFMSGNPGADCQASSGHSTQFFYFANQYIENTASTGQYTVCSYPIIRDSTLPYTVDGTTGFNIGIGLYNAGATAANFTCAVVVGFDSIAAVSQATVVKTLTVAAGAFAPLFFSTAELPIKNRDSFAAVNCLLPPNGRERYISVQQPKNF